MRDTITYNSEVRRKLAEELGTERQEMIGRIVQKIDEFILETSDGAIRKTCELTNRAFMTLLVSGFDLKTNKNEDRYQHTAFGDPFEEEIHEIVNEELFRCSEDLPEVKDCIQVLVADRIFEKVKIEFSARLKSHTKTSYIKM